MPGHISHDIRKNSLSSHGQALVNRRIIALVWESTSLGYYFAFSNNILIVIAFMKMLNKINENS